MAAQPKKSFHVRIEAPGLKSLPDRLKRAERKMLSETGEDVARLIGIESRSKQIAAKTHALPAVADSVLVMVGVGVPFTLIRDRGGSIEAREGSVLAFASGEFRPRAVQKGIGYIRSAGQKAGLVVSENYHDAFTKI